MGMNRELIGKVYPTNVWEVTAAQIGAYASAYNDDNPAFHDETRPGGIVAPPLFNVVPPAMSLGSVFFDGDLRVNFAKLLHGEQDIRLHAPIRPGDTITCEASIPDIIEKSSGEILLVEVRSTNQNGTLVAEQVFTFFVRGKKKEEDAPAAPKPPAPEKDRGEPTVAGTSEVMTDQTDRYAEASLDRNPIHLDNDFAKSVGLPGRINHGLCTMAMASKVVIDKCLGGDPGRLARIKLRFKNPVTLGQTLTTRIWKMGENSVQFETCDAGGKPVLVDGVAEFRP